MGSDQDTAEIRREMDALKQRLAELDAKLEQAPRQDWQSQGFYTDFYAAVGAAFGMMAAFSSLLFNIVGATLLNEYPLKLIQVYLTFPLGASALALQGGLALTLGVCLYVATGMLLGIPFHLALVKLAAHRSLTYRLLLATLLGVLLWVVNFYGILSWLQPLLFGGNWIVKQVPPYVGAMTHLVFGWTMALLTPLGIYQRYRLQTETA